MTSSSSPSIVTLLPKRALSCSVPPASMYFVLDVLIFNPTFSASRLSLVYCSATASNFLLTMSTSSSAKQINWLDRLKIVPRMLNAARRLTPSSAMLNSRQERPSPCRSPLRDSNEPDNPPDILTQHWFPSIVALISRVSFPVASVCLMFVDLPLNSQYTN